MKSGQSSDYKQLPLKGPLSKLAAIDLRNPPDGRWCGLFSRTAMFGAIAAVSHYNISP